MKATITKKNVDTRDDVAKLFEQYEAVAYPGNVIPYDEIEKIINEPRHSDRWKSIIKRLKNRFFKEKNCYLKAKINEGYEILNNVHRIDESGNLMKHGVKRIIKSGVVAQTTKTTGLNEEQKKNREHAVNFASIVSGHVKMIKRTELIMQD